ncbi:hypothetical protein PF011_g29747 [Phytophthora fragariae]|uniref:SWIM-type domain-containing protein n=2 Tax=Phytophthora TaxID=4783 RepID=A0A6A3GWQ7_9STRA|nr:hypothetical protein PF011_g29747 [Phytophthora fragariae]
MVAMDQYGNGQPVQYSLIETNSDWHMAKCMDHFKRANEHWRFVRIVIVDKDMREIDIIRKKFPEARVLLCHFHVIKWLHETIRKSKKYGVYEEDVLSQMKHTITNMTYARTPDAYTSHRDEFKSLALREDRTELWDYFVKNWDECCEMWVMAYRVGLPHFGNHTNNRVESLFGKLKRYLKGHLTMRASLKVLLAYQRRKEEEYTAKVEMPGTLRDVSYCEQMNIALGMTTRWVAAAIKTQYDVATDDSIADNYAFKDNGTTVTVQCDERKYTLEKEGWTCNCEFAQTMKLPCRHAMAYRKTCGNPLIIPFSSISPRWFGQSRLSQDELTEVEQPFVAKVFKKKPRAVAGVLSDAEKYRRAQQAFSRISGELAQLPDEVFESAMSDLDKWWYNLRHGKTDLLPPPSSGNDGSGSGGGGNDGGAPGGSASQGKGPQDDHHDGNAKEGNMQDDYGSYDEAPTQVADSTTQAADCEGSSRG